MKDEVNIQLLREEYQPLPIARYLLKQENELEQFSENKHVQYSNIYHNI